MRVYTPYEAIYSYDKLHQPDPPLVPENLPPITYLEKTWMNMEGSLLNPYGNNPPISVPKNVLILNQSDPWELPEPSWKRTKPILPDPTGDPWKDAENEFRLINTLNALGGLRARRKFINMQRYLAGSLSPSEKEMLKLADFTANESMAFMFDPGIVTAMGLLREYWPRWFGGKALKTARYNPDICWVPWSFFMGDDYINGKKNDLVANILNQPAMDELYKVLATAGKLNDKINDFNFSDEDPMLWNTFAHQSRAVNLYSLMSYRKPQYWALGNFSIFAVPEGATIPLEGGGHRICVSNVYLYIHDTFNFEGFEFLGLWDTENKKFPSLSPSMLALSNSDFRAFREKHGFGKNFTVLSPLYKLSNFDGKCWDVK